jgi:3-oxoadipate enol-lactonase
MPILALEGCDLHYEDHGSGPPVLLIHGSGASAETWGSAGKELAKTHHVIAYDRRGSGRSSGRNARDFRRNAVDAAALLKSLGVRSLIVGWSSGGVIALDLATRNPELVSALLLIEPIFHGFLHPCPSVSRAFFGSHLRRIRGKRAAAEYFYRWVFRYSTGGTAFDHFPPSWREIMLGNARSALSDFLPAVHPTSGEYLRRRDLAAIECPVTCLGGELSDPWFRPLRGALAKLVPQTEIRIAGGASHAVHFDRPDVVEQAVRNR